MRGKVAKGLRKMAKLSNPDLPWVHYEWVDPSVMVEFKTKEEMKQTTLVIVDCQKAEYNFLKRVYKEIA